VIGLTITAVRDQAENVVGASVVFRDLDLVERLEEAARLRERLAALGEMAAGLAHEIRNPLAGLKVTTELLARRVGADAEAAELIREMSDEIGAVEGTVDAALAFVKPVPVALRSLDLVEVLEDAYTRVSARVPFAGTVQRFYETPAPHVTGDPDQLRSVFANLLENACESMSELRERGVLQLEVVTVPVDRSEQILSARSGVPQAAMRGGREVWVTVADSGPGIAPELRQKVFYPFFTTRESGSGVGLATAQKIVAAHGGALELIDAPIRGAAFRVRLAVGGAP
jgi:signal transduction histidine kinase